VNSKINNQKMNPVVKTQLPTFEVQDKYSQFNDAMKKQRDVVSKKYEEFRSIMVLNEIQNCPVVRSVHSSIGDVLSASWGELYKNVESCFILLSAAIPSLKVFGFSDSFLEITSDSIIKIQVIISKMGGTFKIRTRMPTPKLAPISSDIPEETETMFCRICEEKVRVDMMEEHTISCLSAFQAHNQINVLNLSLTNYADEIKANHLSEKWGGDGNKIVTDVLPIYHLLLLIERAIQVTPAHAECVDELRILGDQLRAIKISPECISNKIIEDFSTALLTKIKICENIRSASDVLIRSRISGSPHPAEQLSQVTIADFEFLKKISRGAFAQVYLAKKKKTDSIYAIKVLSKNDVIKKNQGRRVLAEKDILLNFVNPYIINFYYSIIGVNNLYLVMEYLPGGDIYSVLQHLGTLDEESAKIYLYQIIKGLEFLRECGIIHRDLKPDNILVTEEGTIKLIDFGLSYCGYLTSNLHNQSLEKIIESDSIVGTPDYTAPEIVNNKPHSFSADYWSLGVMLYEFLTGVTPFHDENEQKTFSRIRNNRYTPLSPEEYSEEVINLLQGLLEPDPTKRLGSSNIQDILNHEWFKDLDPNNMDVPFIPKLDSNDDTSYFRGRYPLLSDDEKTIREDFVSATKQVHVASSFSFNNGQVPINQCDGIEGFPSVDLKHLAIANCLEARKTRRRSLSTVSMLKRISSEDNTFHQNDINEVHQEMFSRINIACSSDDSFLSQNNPT